MSADQTAIPFAILRGGTSRGLYFEARHLPADDGLRTAVLIHVLGGPDELQVDGIGGGHALTNKIAVVGPSSHPHADVDYLFLQGVPSEGRLGATQNCGNILAGVAAFAIECGLVDARSPETAVTVHMVNSGNLACITVQTPDARPRYDGDTEIDGVPGMAAPVICEFLDVAGSVCGALLPTGNVLDMIDDLQVTCIDNGMPVVIVRAADLGKSGYETPGALDSDTALKARLESLRLRAGRLMDLGDVTEKTIPKMCMIAAPANDGHIATRTFIPHVCHRSIGVLGAVSVATACLLPGSVTEDIAQLPPGDEKTFAIEHPSGSFLVRVVCEDSDKPAERVRSVGVVRTVRLLARGEVYVPASVWTGTR